MHVGCEWLSKEYVNMPRDCAVFLKAYCWNAFADATY